jgi:hypothetical protein
VRKPVISMPQCWPQLPHYQHQDYAAEAGMDVSPGAYGGPAARSACPLSTGQAPIKLAQAVKSAGTLSKGAVATADGPPSCRSDQDVLFFLNQ